MLAMTFGFHLHLTDRETEVQSPLPVSERGLGTLPQRVGSRVGHFPAVRGRLLPLLAMEPSSPPKPVLPRTQL